MNVLDLAERLQAKRLPNSRAVASEGTMEWLADECDRLGITINDARCLAALLQLADEFGSTTTNQDLIHVAKKTIVQHIAGGKTNGS